MLRDVQPKAFSKTDLEVFDKLVLRDDPLRLALEAIDFGAIRRTLAEFYHPDEGRSAVDPVLLIKLELLMFRDRLSDRGVMQRARTDLAYRFFLGLSADDFLPDPSLLSRFRTRLKEDGFRKVFDEILRQAKQAGFLKSRLRLTDSTHVIGDAAAPGVMTLLAQSRDRVLDAAAEFAPQLIADAREQLQALRIRTEQVTPAARLEARMVFCRELLDDLKQLAVPTGDKDNQSWQKLEATRFVLEKIVAEASDPRLSDRTRSVVDSDLRRGKHGDFYDGYRVSMMMDADSELITHICVTPANSDEASLIPGMLRSEYTALQTHVEAVSIDGVGFDGPVLRELQDPEDLHVKVIVPPKAEPETKLFTAEDFPEAADGQHVTCPQGEQSKYRQRDEAGHVTIHRFESSTCAGCPLLTQCMAKAPEQFGRSVRKNDYTQEYAAARQFATTEEYKAVRREHPKIERKQGELVLRHDCRRARYRGRERVGRQMILGTIAVNVKRFVKLVGRLFVSPRALLAAH